MPAAGLCKSFLITKPAGSRRRKRAEKSKTCTAPRKPILSTIKYHVVQIKSWDVEYSIQSQLFYFILNSLVSLPDFLINHLTPKIKNETIPSCITDYVCNSFVLCENQWKWSKMREEMIEFEVDQVSVCFILHLHLTSIFITSRLLGGAAATSRPDQFSCWRGHTLACYPNLV